MTPIKIINTNEWFSQKEDPTCYDSENDIIYVRSDYDEKTDPYGWIVHEKIHAYLFSIKFEDNLKPPLVKYPFNESERYAFTWQFVYLLETKQIQSLDNIKLIMPWKFEWHGNEWAKKYFNEAKIKARSDYYDTPLMIHLSESNYERQLEDAFRKIVDDAKTFFKKAKSNPQITDTTQERNLSNEDLIISDATNYSPKKIPRKGCAIATISVILILAVFFLVAAILL